jgi:2-polyprenyl-3-methyl-5-hydroxy-6-metoxy-1,4-benzoquinol methylase
MRDCLGCAKKIDSGLLCVDCNTDPFIAEDARKALAKKGDFENLKKLYGTDTAFFPQGSVDKLWKRILLDQEDDHLYWNTHRTNTTLELVQDEFPNCIDVACGQGYALSVLKQRNPKMDVYGIDMSKEKIEALSKKIDGKFAVAKVDEVPFKIKFKLALLLEVLEHVEVPKSRDFLRSIYNLLDDDGQFVISVPAEDNLRQMMNLCPHCGNLTHAIGHVRSYSKELITAELKLAGFEVVSYIGIAGGKYFGISRQALMPYFPQKIRPMVFAFRCKKII